MTKQAMHQARDALTPLANAHFPIERENLSDDDVSKAGLAIAALEAAIAAPEPVLTVPMSAAKTPRELIEAARIKYFTEAVAENHEDLFHEYATTAISLLPSLLAAHDEEIAALKAARPVQPAPYNATSQILNEVMETAVGNGANSISMPDEYVEVALWLSYVDQPQPAPAEPEQKAYRRPVMNRCPKCVGLSCLCDGLCTKPVATSQTAPAAPYQVTDEDVKAALSTYYAITGLDEFAEESLQDMRKALEKHEARKATA